MWQEEREVGTPGSEQEEGGTQVRTEVSEGQKRRDSGVAATKGNKCGWKKEGGKAGRQGMGGARKKGK